MSKKTVLITGCSQGGIGAALAKTFHSKGYHVFATVRNKSKADPFLQSDDNNTKSISILDLEITSPDSIKACAELVRERTGGSLDILVNNAGMGLCLPLLDTSIDEAKKVYDLNVWGILAVAQAFTPMLVKAKGVVCNISSVAACFPSAWGGIYNSSKAATTLLSETLRLELSPLGVRVITAMTGAVNTQFFADRTDLILPETSYYQPIRDVIDRENKGLIYTNKQDVDVYAKNLVNDIVSGKSGLVWRGQSSSMAWLLSAILPGRLLAYLVNGDKGLDELARANRA
ncbi:short-chain dehydrogenase/reductase, putative [Talaromyces stipitatus ATCC 10500]|uniref:Short-chain dehydrogenase/reductase, putative n=1 Tax=Talaromyces stipitatus (strain ATCC 10500 / CBS 375.48 / QM 6759 / NRRL 1006) TaxID=441959 RepID=B8M0P8_TALSN|nr:short-chain dehydrogenase/reductase, putative [Talaromyces stipitatus ATCC 10500]EED21431.1 short-chain dehydrogenase/reductase, putative [Talaromyces stipitatus ATCC 10500]